MNNHGKLQATTIEVCYVLDAENLKIFQLLGWFSYNICSLNFLLKSFSSFSLCDVIGN